MWVVFCFLCFKMELWISEYIASYLLIYTFKNINFVWQYCMNSLFLLIGRYVYLSFIFEGFFYDNWVLGWQLFAWSPFSCFTHIMTRHIFTIIVFKLSFSLKYFLISIMFSFFDSELLRILLLHFKGIYALLVGFCHRFQEHFHWTQSCSE